MALYDLTKKTKASTGQKITRLGAPDNTMRVIKLEQRINNQEQKLDKILELLQNGNNLMNIHFLLILEKQIWIHFH